MLNYLKDFGVFNVINGLIICKPQDKLYYEEFKEVYLDVLRYCNVPIMYNLNFGHALPRSIIPYGAKVCLDLDNKSLTMLDDIFKL